MLEVSVGGVRAVIVGATGTGTTDAVGDADPLPAVSPSSRAFRRHLGPSRSSAMSSSSSQATSALAGRSSGRFASIRMIQSEIRGSSAGSCTIGGSACSLTWRSSTAIGVAELPNGGRPVNSS